MTDRWHEERLRLPERKRTLWAKMAVLFAALWTVVFPRSLTIANGDGFTIVARVSSPGGSFVDYIVPAADTRKFLIPEAADAVTLINFGTGSVMAGAQALPANSSAVLHDWNTLEVVAVSEASGAGGADSEHTVALLLAIFTLGAIALGRYYAKQ